MPQVGGDPDNNESTDKEGNHAFQSTIWRCRRPLRASGADGRDRDPCPGPDGRHPGTSGGRGVEASSLRRPDPGRRHRNRSADQLVRALRAPECSRRRARCARSPDRLRRDGPVRFAGGGADRHGRHRDVVNGHFPERNRGYGCGGGNHAPRPWHFGRSAHRGGLRARPRSVPRPAAAGPRLRGHRERHIRPARHGRPDQLPGRVLGLRRPDTGHLRGRRAGGQRPCDRRGDGRGTVVGAGGPALQRHRADRGDKRGCRVDALRLGRGHRGHSGLHQEGDSWGAADYGAGRAGHRVARTLEHLRHGPDLPGTCRIRRDQRDLPEGPLLQAGDHPELLRGRLGGHG